VLYYTKELLRLFDIAAAFLSNERSSQTLAEMHSERPPT
jgi:hypothetical protein